MAKGLGVSKDNIHIDYNTKLVTIDMEPDKFDQAACTKALEDGGYGLKGMM